MVQFRRGLYVIIIICLLAIDVTNSAETCNSDSDVKPCGKDNKEKCCIPTLDVCQPSTIAAVPGVKPCLSDVRGDQTTPCCIWTDENDWKYKKRVKGKPREIEWRSTSVEETGKQKCKKLGRELVKTNKQSGIRHEFVCGEVPECSVKFGPSGAINEPCGTAGAKWPRCIIESDGVDDFKKAKCSDFEYKVQTFRPWGEGDSAISAMAKAMKPEGKLVGSETKKRKPWPGATERVCAQYNYIQDLESKVGEFEPHTIKICQTAATSTVWLDYNNERYDNGNEYLLSLQIAGLWLVSILFVACTCFCAGAIAFYAVQMAHRWISKNIKN